MKGEMKQKGNAECKKPFNSYQSFVKRGQRIKMAAELGMVRSSRTDRQWIRALCNCLASQKPKAASYCKEEAADITGCDDRDEELDIGRRLKALQRLIPGGEDMEIESLFEETADYIEALKGQVNLMRNLAQVIDEMARERRRMGG